MSNEFEKKTERVTWGLIPDLSENTRKIILNLFPWIIIVFCGYDLFSSLQPVGVHSALRVRYVPYEKPEFLDVLFAFVNFIFSIGSDVAGFVAAYLMYYRKQGGWLISLYLPIIWLIIQTSHALLSIIQVIVSKGVSLGLVLFFFVSLKIISMGVAVYVIIFFLFQIRHFYFVKE